MKSYRFKRRAFIQAVGGGLGLKVMLRNLESAAQTAKSPARLLITHWPVGIVQTGFAPTSGSVGGSKLLQGFADAGLANDMTVLRGVSTAGLASNGGGGHEAGTVKLVTGVACPGTRSGEQEGDDAYAGGPSFDQIFLKNVPALKSPMGGAGYANSICDSRVDVTEISTQCLSYDYATTSVGKYGGGTGTQNSPKLPILSPLNQWMNLFSNFVVGGGGVGGASGMGGGSGSGAGGAGGAGPAVAPAMLKQLALRRSVLDFSLAELTQMRTMVPSASKDLIDIHTTAIRNVETQLANSIGAIGGPMAGTGGRSGAGGMNGGVGGSSGMAGSSGNAACATKPAAPPNVTGSSGSPGLQYGGGQDVGKTDDSALHAMVGQLHTDVLKAAFICDLIRVGTFQWSPGTNHVSFKGMFPGETSTIYQHHPTSHRIGTYDTQATTLGSVAGFLANIQAWYHKQHANIFAGWKTQLDGFGNSLLDYTVVPYVTEVQATGHEQDNMAAMIIGGKALGFTHNIYKTGNWPIGQYWGTIAQAFGLSPTAPIGNPISGLWVKPPG